MRLRFLIAGAALFAPVGARATSIWTKPVQVPGQHAALATSDNGKLTWAPWLDTFFDRVPQQRETVVILSSRPSRR